MKVRATGRAKREIARASKAPPSGVFGSSLRRVMRKERDVGPRELRRALR